MMLDRVLAIFSLAALAAFVGIVAAFVRETDLTIFVLIVVAAAGYDFWRELSRQTRRGRQP